MKKITLMLCACAMAFAGLLVSCSNGAEKWIDGTTHSSHYEYAITGTVSESYETGNTTSTTVTKGVFTLSKGIGVIGLNSEDSREENEDNTSSGYIFVNGKGDASNTVGTADPVKVYNVTYQNYDISLKKLDDNWFVRISDYASAGNIWNNSISFDYVKLDTAPEFDGSDYNLKVSLVKDDGDSEAGSVDKKTLSFDINFKAVDAE